MGHLVWQPLVGAAFALYTVAVAVDHARWRITWLVAASSGIVLLVGALVGPSPSLAVDLSWLLTGGIALGVAWTLGQVVRDRRIALARAAAQMAEQAVIEERLRIARELHDIVSHTLSLIGVKAGVARHVASSHPEEVLETLRTIEEASREALDQMRHMLGTLRTNGDRPDTAPNATLDRLPELASRAEQAGVLVDLHVDPARQLPAAIESSVYRIVQEGLTNVVRHAAPTRCRVIVATEGGQAVVEIADDGPGESGGDRTSPGISGHGLIGMRERVLLHGGTLTAGPGPHGGFLLRVRLPLVPAGRPT